MKRNILGKDGNVYFEDDPAWEARVQQLEVEGLTRSDAQAVVDAEEAKGKLPHIDRN